MMLLLFGCTFLPRPTVHRWLHSLLLRIVVRQKVSSISYINRRRLDSAVQHGKDVSSKQSDHSINRVEALAHLEGKGGPVWKSNHFNSAGCMCYSPSLEVAVWGCLLSPSLGVIVSTVRNRR
jgi:hypothetical protein